MTVTDSYAIVVKGTGSIKKSSAVIPITFEKVDGYGIRVMGLGSAQWLAGNRKHIPAISPGTRFNLHRGNPLQYVTIEIR